MVKSIKLIKWGLKSNPCRRMTLSMNNFAVVFPITNFFVRIKSAIFVNLAILKDMLASFLRKLVLVFLPLKAFSYIFTYGIEKF